MSRAIPLGRIVITRNALIELEPEDIFTGVRRHAHGDWGEMDTDDCRANDSALQTGERLLSVYRSADRVKFWVITEWDRSVTTVLLPEDY